MHVFWDQEKLVYLKIRATFGTNRVQDYKKKRAA
jgi:hypothetical protein